MTLEEQIALVQSLLQNDPLVTSSVATLYLDVAESEVLGTLYPFGYEPSAVTTPARYETIKCQLASRIYSRRGALGETTHTEDGIGRTFATTDDSDLLSQIVPIAKVV